MSVFVCAHIRMGVYICAAYLQVVRFSSNLLTQKSSDLPYLNRFSQHGLSLREGQYTSGPRQ